MPPPHRAQAVSRAAQPPSAARHSSRQSHSARHTEQVTIHYPWHPLHGKTIDAWRSVRHGREVWLCEHDQRTAAIPVWMTDRVACAAPSVGGPILVAVEALIELASVCAARAAASGQWQARATGLLRLPRYSSPAPAEIARRQGTGKCHALVVPRDRRSFPAIEEPKLLVEDLRTFFRPLRS